MRKKLISKTYLRNVDKYRLDIHYENNEYYLAIKKIIHTNEPFILPTGLCLIDNNYYIVEILPKNENYTVRIYLNEKKERLGYYFDISLGNGIDEESQIPYYDDLYLDVAIDNNNIEILDEDELEEALNTNKITTREFELANKTMKNLLKSIENNSNKYMQLNVEKYLV